MIGFSDAFTLARAKLRTKKLLLVITIIISGLLFGVLTAAITAVSGLADSANTYTKLASDGKYLVKTSPIFPMEIFGFDNRFDTPSAEIQAKFSQIEKDYTAEQKILYEKHGLEFTDKMVIPVLMDNPYGNKNASGKVTQVINPQSPIWNIYLDQIQAEWANSTKASFTDVSELAKKYGATNVSGIKNASISFQTTSFLKDNKEDFTDIGKMFEAKSAYMNDHQETAARNSNYTFASQSTVQRFMLPDNDLRQGNTTAIPVIITTGEAVAIFGDKFNIPKKPDSAAEQIDWMRDLQEKVNGQTYQACYRSGAEIELINQQRLDDGQMIINEGDKDYVEPKLQYNLPTETCGALTVKKDTRTTAEKNLTAKQEVFQKDAGTYQPLERQLLTFQIVGVMEQGSYGLELTTDLSKLTSAVLGAQYQTGAFIVNDLYDKLPEEARHESILKEYVHALRGARGMGSGTAFQEANITETIITFTSVEEARAFIDKEGCSPMRDSQECLKDGRLSNTITYGSNYLVVDDISKQAQKFIFIALPVALVIAGIIILITMARVIIDSRRETAVFRALGAKRGDIMSVYLIYSLIVASFIVLFALAIGLAGALVLEYLYASDLTDYARVAYGMFTSSENFSFIGFNIPFIGLIIASIFGVSIVAILPPLIRNVRRNPIRDMRDDG